MTKIAIGTTVRVTDGIYPNMIGKVGVVRAYAGSGSALVQFDGWRQGHDGYGHQTNDFTTSHKDCWFLPPNTLSVVKETNPMQTIRAGTQNFMILQHLISGRTLTRIQADHLYRVASLTRRIRDLRDAGHSIVATTKVDPTGRNYVEYALTQRDRFGNRKAA